MPCFNPSHPLLKETKEERRQPIRPPCQARRKYCLWNTMTSHRLVPAALAKSNSKRFHFLMQIQQPKSWIPITFLDLRHFFPFLLLLFLFFVKASGNYWELNRVDSWVISPVTQFYLLRLTRGRRSGTKHDLARHLLLVMYFYTSFIWSEMGGCERDEQRGWHLFVVERCWKQGLNYLWGGAPKITGWGGPKWGVKIDRFCK